MFVIVQGDLHTPGIVSILHLEHGKLAAQQREAMDQAPIVGGARQKNMKANIDLQKTQDASGLWPQDAYTGGGFPRVFYLRYHGYPKFFPLWALARYRNLKRANTRRVAHGM